MKKYVVSLFPPHGDVSNVTISADYVSAMPREIVFFDAEPSARSVTRYEEYVDPPRATPTPPTGRVTPSPVAILQIGEGFSYALSVEE